MRKILIITILTSLIAGSALAEPKYYIEAKSGSAFKTSKLHDHFGGKLSKSAIYGAAIGIQPSDQFAFDVSLLFTPQINYKYNGPLKSNPSQIKRVSSKFKNVTFMVNSYYYLLDSSHTVVPYVGVGIGLARNTLSDAKHYVNNVYKFTRKGKTANSLTWGLSAGTLFNLNNNFKATLEYRYSDLGVFKNSPIDIDYRNISHNVVQSKTRLRSHSILAGLRYQF